MLHTGHPSIERLAELVGGRVGARARSTLEQHVSQCARCSAQLDRLLTTVAQANGIVERLIGVLRSDSRTTRPSFGLRSTSYPVLRQRIFEAGHFDVEVRSVEAGVGWSVSGQILGPTDATSGDVRLIGHAVRAHAELTQFLEFTLPPVPAGTYALIVQLGSGTSIEIENLELRP